MSLFLAATASAQTDNFNRADGALGSNWQGNYTATANLTIVGQKVRSTAVNTSTAQTWATPVSLTQSAQVTLATLGVNGEGAVLLRATAPPTRTYYYIAATRSGPSNTIIYRCEAGTCSLVDEDFSSNTWAPGDQLKATIDSGGTISVFHNGTQYRTFIDPTPLTGTYTGVSIYLYSGAATLAEVELDNFDNGTTATAGTITWTCNRCAVTSGSAVGTAPPSLTNWVINNLTLAPGLNVITVTVTDGSGNSSTDTITVTFIPSFPGNTLAGSWGFEAGSGTTAIDSSGNSNTATFVGTPTWQAAGRYGNAISFNGIDQSLTVPDPANNSLDFTQSFTLSAWVQPSVIHTDYRAVMAKANSTGGGGPSYALYASVDSSTCPAIGSGAVAGLVHINGTSGPTYVVCGAPLATGIWTHIAVTYDGIGGTLKLYRNGVLTATTATVPPPGVGIMEPSTGPLQMGASEFGEQFAGAIDEPRAYNYPLLITAGSNTVPGAACVRNQTPSVVGDMNCSVVASGTILAFKIPASATGLKVGPTGSLKVGSH
jgi:hypothetical protein